MCGRKSSLGLRSIAALFLLSSLLASPCFAAASWAGIIGESSASPASGSLTALSGQSPGESSGRESTPQSQPPQSSSLEPLLSQLDSLKQEQRNLETLSQNLRAQLEACRQTAEISEAEYQAVYRSLVGMAEVNSEQADSVAALDGQVRLLEEQLKSASGTRPYVKLNAGIGFRDDEPTWALGAGGGVRIGRHIMLEGDVGYTFGEFTDIFDLSADNWEFTLGVGWMF